MKRLICAILSLLLILALLPGCGKADISDYADRKILITGLLDEDFYVTPGELSQLECVSATARENSEKAGTVHAYGPTLETFLAQYGVSLDQLKSVKVKAEDGYSITLGRVTWDKYDVILSIAAGSRPLPDYQQPLRVVVPGGDSGNWVRLVTELQFTYLQ